MIERVVRTFRLPSLRQLAVLLALALLVTACSDDGQERRRSLGDTLGSGDFMRVADAERGGRLFGQCAACHTVRMGAGDRNGPGLYDVVGKPVASNSRRFGYTGALRSTGGVWTPERLDAWLSAPAKFAPGTSMSFRGVPDPLDRADVIAYLQAQSVEARGVEAPPPRGLDHLLHSGALEFHPRSGFIPCAFQIEVAPAPRLTGVLPRTCAQHVPLLG